MSPPPVSTIGDDVDGLGCLPIAEKEGRAEGRVRKDSMRAVFDKSALAWRTAALTSHPVGEEGGCVGGGTKKKVNCYS